MLGINTGTLGFMAGLEADQLDKLKLLTTGEYDISERMTIDVVIHGPEGDEVYTALNEVSARSGNFRICDFDVCSDGYLVGRYRADGVLFSTPSGSTAYALSAGGPVIEPDLECIEMTLICPHSLFYRATMFSPGRQLRFTLKNPAPITVLSPLSHPQLAATFRPYSFASPDFSGFALYFLPHLNNMVNIINLIPRSLIWKQKLKKIIYFAASVSSCNT